MGMSSYFIYAHCSPNCCKTKSNNNRKCLVLMQCLFRFHVMFWRIRMCLVEQFIFIPFVFLFQFVLMNLIGCNSVQMYLCAHKVCNSVSPSSPSSFSSTTFSMWKRKKTTNNCVAVNKWQWQFIFRLISPSARHSNNDFNEKINLESGDGHVMNRKTFFCCCCCSSFVSILQF